jgi:glycosyltransferase involved in cell wall biosynthesis
MSSLKLFMNIKLGILFSNFGPYHLARIKGCIDHCKQYQTKVVAIELAQSEEKYCWKTKREDYNFPIFSAIQDQKLEKTNIFYLLLTLNLLLNNINPDVIAVVGYSQPGMLYTLLWGIWNRKPIILLTDSKENDELRIWWKEKLKSLIIKQYKAALVAGETHKQYLTKLGMPSETIFLGYDVVDNQTFHPNNICHFPRPLKRPYFLAINRFVSKKNLPLLISAYAQYFQIRGYLAWDLVLSGDGELRPQIEQQIKELGLQKFIHLPGFLQQEELLPYFAHASCFIHASTQEQWGLVVNEAMAAGLPVIVSNRCGCFEDLVIEGVNGFGFDPTNQQKLTDLMLKMSSGKVDLSVMGEASLQHIQKYSPDYFAQGLMKALEYSLANS